MLKKILKLWWVPLALWLAVALPSYCLVMLPEAWWKFATFMLAVFAGFGLFVLVAIGVTTSFCD